MDVEDDRKILRPQFGDAKLVVDHTERFCAHEYLTLRPRSETVICRVCDADIDPFDVLLRMARDWQCVTYRRQELDKLDAQIAELKREETNVKARLRSAHKLGAPDPRTQVVFDETLRRLNEACSRQAIYDAEAFLREFKWLEAAQYKLLADAAFRANQRAEAADRASPRRKRAVRVIEGGGGKADG